MRLAAKPNARSLQLTFKRAFTAATSLTTSPPPPPAMAPLVSTADVRAFLVRDYSTHAFRIEYGGYLSNHLLHGVVALRDLGASTEQMQRFAAQYAEKLEPDEVPVDSPEADNQDDLSEEQLKALVGKRERYGALRAFYFREIERLGVDGAVAKHLPGLIGGLAGALLHGLIQLGYAYHLGGDDLVAEGIAYLHFASLSFDEPAAASKPQGEKTKLTRSAAAQLASSVASDEFLVSEVATRVARPPLVDLDIGWIQQGVNALSGHPERGSAAAFAHIWDIVHSLDLNEFNGSVALDFVMWLYVMVDHNDFVVLHAVTSAWSLRQLEHLLEPTDRARAWRVWLHVALSALVVAKVHDYKPSDVCEKCDAQLSTMPTWDAIRADALELGGFPDEHVYKLVQVAEDHARDAKCASQWLSPDERDFVARSAALKVIKEPFKHYRTPPTK